MIPIILLCICCIILGAMGDKPTGWVILTLALLALLFTVLGPHLRIG